jgi:hypothetical protein
VLVLRVPADDRAPLGLVRVTSSLVAFSDVIGGGFLDEHRVPKGLRGNQRSAVLAARLGHVNRRWLADLRGDALIVGVIDAARQSGLLREDPSDGTRTR